MRWLLHGSLPPAVAEALRRHGHQIQTADDAGIDAHDPIELLKAASARQLDVLTNDPQLAHVLYDGNVAFGRSLVLLQLSQEADQGQGIDRLFERYKRLAPGRMYTVTQNRVKIRQIPLKK